MSVRPKYPIPDDNQSQLVEDLRAIGMVVWITASLSTPVLDLIGFWRGSTGIIEVKRPGHEKELRPSERESIAVLEAVGVKVIVASSVEDVIEQWDKPRWRVVDQEAIKAFDKQMGETLARAVRLSNLVYATPHKKKGVCKLKDMIMELNDLWCEAIEFRRGE